LPVDAVAGLNDLGTVLLTPQGPAGTASISGQVLLPDGKSPAAGATVVVGTAAALTGADGSFFLTGVPVGNETVIARYQSGTALPAAGYSVVSTSADQTTQGGVITLGSPPPTPTT
jgi:hypothetical protein